MRFPQKLSLLAVLAVVSIPVYFSSAVCAEEKAVVKVGDVPVTEYEVTREQQKLLPMNSTFHGGISPEKVSKARADALERLIERAYKICYAQASGITLDKGVLEERLEQIQKAYPSYKEFKKAAGKEGVDGVKASVQRELLAVKSEKLAVDDKVKVDDAEIKAYYEQNRSSFMRPRQFKASHIVIKVDPASNKEEREAQFKKAQDLAKRAQAGEDFYNLAYHNSDKGDKYRFVGGDLGYFHEGQISREYQAALDQMKPGSVSDPIRTRVGYNILKLVEVNEPRQFTFDEVKDKIGKNLRAKKREAIYNEWMAGLKVKFPVKRF